MRRSAACRDAGVTCSLVVVVFAMSACASSQGDFRDAGRVGTKAAYEQFLEKHPKAPESASARAQLAQMAAWEKALADNSAAGYRQFLQMIPESEHTDEARKRLAPLQLRADWEEAQRLDTTEAYDRFLNAHMFGEFSSEARRLRAEADARQSEADWQAITSSEKVASFSDFLRKHGSSPHADEARVRIRKLQTPDDPQLLSQMRQAVASARKLPSFSLSEGEYANGIMVRATGSLLVYQGAFVRPVGVPFAQLPSSGNQWNSIDGVQFLILDVGGVPKIPTAIAGFAKGRSVPVGYTVNAQQRLTLLVPREALPCEIEMESVVRGRIEVKDR